MSFTMPYSKLYFLTELNASDVKFISVDRQKLDLPKYIYTYGTVNSILVEIQPNSTNIKMTLVSNPYKHSVLFVGQAHLIWVFTCLPNYVFKGCKSLYGRVSVREDNPRDLASGLSNVKTHKPYAYFLITPACICTLCTAGYFM